MPWLLLARVAPQRAFRWSYVIGVLFFLASIWWITYVTVLGWIILCLYLALYFGVFGFLASRMRLRFPTSNIQLLLVPSLWVALEYARAHLLSGFGWNLLAYSQAPWRAIIQVADVTGAWGVSFLVVLVNVSVAELVAWRLRPLRGVPRTAAIPRTCLALAIAAVLAALGYAAWRLPQVSGRAVVRLAVVQGNIPQEEKWEEANREKILAGYEALSVEAAATNPDLIVWPETSVPGFFGADESLTQRIFSLARTLRRPLLVGAPMYRIRPEGFLLTNSAALVDAAGDMAARHDKMHLVPLGEFVPFERAAPWLRRLLPPIGDFIPGAERTIFALANGSQRFSVLICFEDLFPELARRFVIDGARFLLVITNDAWFGPTAAAYQHAQASTLRAVECRVPVARAANTGWSGCIDAAGRSAGSVHDANGRELFVGGTRTCDLPLGIGQSLYLRWGDWFAWLCVLLSVPELVSLLRRRAKLRRRRRPS